MTSASAASFAKGKDEGKAGTKEVTTMLAVEVGERWSVSGWTCDLGEDEGDPLKVGFGRARTWACRLVSKKFACSSITFLF